METEKRSILSMIAVGNVQSGLKFIGPFDLSTEAYAYAKRHLGKRNWTILSVYNQKALTVKHMKVMV